MNSCGLVMKEDITQHICCLQNILIGCGLVMKEDITQPKAAISLCVPGCGLVMKEDITQQSLVPDLEIGVVVW